MAKFVLSSFADEAAESIDEQIRISLANDISFMEIRNVDGRSIVSLPSEQWREIHKKLLDQGMGVSAIGSGCGKININEDFAPHLELFKRTVECAHTFDAKTIRMFSFFISPNENADFYEGKVFDRLGQFIRHRDGIIAAHENEKEIFGDTPVRCKKIMDAFGNDMVLVFDPANFVQCGQDSLKAYELLEQYIAYMHVKDALLQNGRVVPAGQGDGQVLALIRRFAQKDGERFLSVEPHLKVFPGFSALEAHKNTEMESDTFVYESNEEAYGAAVSALRRIMADI